ncbi:hypothetical protein [Carnimonas bestiolae]|uniref:hypothetical protein n=1 Tax=Carnimonas bestiolae TaxID=3402172 RepID=UPI003EDB8ADF
MRRISKKWLHRLVTVHGLGKALDARYQRLGLFKQYAGLDALDIYIKKCYPKGEDLLPGFSYQAVREELFNDIEDVCIARILGNDLVPRHKLGQTLENTRYLLEHEQRFAGCEKIWILNRFSDRTVASELKALIASYGQEYVEIPFIPSQYREIGLEPTSEAQLRQHIGTLENCGRPSQVMTLGLGLLQRKIRYAMPINEARNVALEQARLRARWALPMDGNCIITRQGWNDFHQAVQAKRKSIYAMPMARADVNDAVEKRANKFSYTEEPQLAFNRYSDESFDEGFYYSRRDKVEFIWRLGKKGVWDKYKDAFFDPSRRPAGELKSRYGGEAGRVIRLSSGTEDGQISSGDRHAMRLKAIVDYIAHLDEALGVEKDKRLDIGEFTERLRSLF